MPVVSFSYEFMSSYYCLAVDVDVTIGKGFSINP